MGRSLAVACVCAVALCFAFGAGGQRLISQTSHAANTQMSEFRPIAIDVRDKDAVARWASRMCTGLDLQEAAKVLETEPTASAIARALTIHLPSPSREAAITACEAALKSAG